VRTGGFGRRMVRVRFGHHQLEIAELLERQMLEHAKNLEFEKAARTRDQLAALREQAFGASVADNVVPLASGATATPLKRN